MEYLIDLDGYDGTDKTVSRTFPTPRLRVDADVSMSSRFASLH
jgi:hypothetical protein